VQVIPVIDLMKGQVVHAKKGQRDSYRPIQTPLCKGSSPRAVIDGLLSLHGFDTLYVADLDALTGAGGHSGLLEGLQRDYPSLEFWIDQGLPLFGPPDMASNGVRVVGSESLDGGRLKWLQSLGSDFILSLDFLAESILGEKSLLDDSRLWPDRVIIMSLSRVGANQGPDFERLKAFRTRHPDKHFVAAGGVRDAADLKRLDALGVGGVLLASALHTGALAPSDLRSYSR